MATMVTMERDLPRLSQLPLPTPMLMLTAAMATTERGPQMLSLQLSPLLLLTRTLTLMRGTDTTDTVAMDGVATTGPTATTATTDTDTVAMDGVATIGLTATTVTTERGLQMLSLQLSQLLLLTLKLMLMLGMDTTDTV